MPGDWKTYTPTRQAATGPTRPRPTRPRPTTITEVARRYHAAAVALAQTLGLPLEQVLREHRESVTAIFIECGKCELRLAPGVALPPLVTNGQTSPETAPDAVESFRKDDLQKAQGGPPEPEAQAQAAEAPEAESLGGSAITFPEAPPTAIPAGLPCAGSLIVDLQPAQLRMLLSKVDQLAAEQGSRWRPLLEVLAAERQARIDRGRKPRLVEAPGGGA